MAPLIHVSLVATTALFMQMTIKPTAVNGFAPPATPLTYGKSCSSCLQPLHYKTNQRYYHQHYHQRTQPLARMYVGAAKQEGMRDADEDDDDDDDFYTPQIELSSGMTEEADNTGNGLRRLFRRIRNGVRRKAVVAATLASIIVYGNVSKARAAGSAPFATSRSSSSDVHVSVTDFVAEEGESEGGRGRDNLAGQLDADDEDEGEELMNVFGEMEDEGEYVRGNDDDGEDDGTTSASRNAALSALIRVTSQAKAVVKTPRGKAGAGIAIVGAAGAVYVISNGSVGGGRGQKRKGAAGGAAKSSFGGFGTNAPPPTFSKPRNIAVDIDLFDDDDDNDDADSPSRPLSSASVRATGPARSAAADQVTSAPTAPVAEIREPAQAQPPAPAPAPVKALATPPKKKKSLLNLFSRDKGNKRPTTLAEVVSNAESSSTGAGRSGSGPGTVSDFVKQLISVLIGCSSNAEVFDLSGISDLPDPPSPTTEGASGTEDLLNAGVAAEMSVVEMAEQIANVVNAMVVSLADEAIDTLQLKDDDATVDKLNVLLDFMDSCGAVFANMCPGIEVDPPIRYNGSARKGKLEDLYSKYAKESLVSGMMGLAGKEGDEDGERVSTAARLDRLQDLFEIKEGKANGITQKVMMDSLGKIMKEGPDGENAELLNSLMGAMGGGDLPDLSGLGLGGAEGGGPDGSGGGGGLGGGGDLKSQIDQFKRMVYSDEVGPEEIRDLKTMYKGMGMDLDELVRQMDAVQDTLGADVQEVYQLLKQLLAKERGGR